MPTAGRKIDSRSGFTLIELTLVIAIIGILVTMVVGSFMASIRKSRDLERKANLNQISKSLEMFYADRGRYPAKGLNGTISACDDYAAPNDCTPNAKWSVMNGAQEILYMALLPTDPRSGRYYYDTDANGTYYQLYANLENQDDSDVHANGAGLKQTYNGTDCGLPATPVACDYAVTSTNIQPYANSHDLTPP